MFDIAWSEYLLVAVVALVLLGPNELPLVLKTLGRWISKARAITRNLENQLYAMEYSDGPAESEKSKPMEFSYQRIFFKQHQLSSHVRYQAAPIPHPWL